MFTKLPPALTIQEGDVAYQVDVRSEDFFKIVYKSGELISLGAIYPARHRILLLEKLCACRESETSDFRKIRFCYEATDRAIKRVLEYMQNKEKKITQVAGVGR